jgi:hypothetical protein
MKPLYRTAGVAIVLIGVLGWLGTRSKKSPAESEQPVEVPDKAPKKASKKTTKQTYPPAVQDQEHAGLKDINQAEAPLAEAIDHDPEANFDDPEDIPPRQSVWGLTKEGIDGAIREIMSDIRGCYQAALTDIPDLEGGLMVNFTVSNVDGIGQVTKIGIRDTRSTTALQLVDEPFEDCVMDHFETLEFDAPGSGGDTIIHYPFQFSPG